MRQVLMGVSVDDAHLERVQVAVEGGGEGPNVGQEAQGRRKGGEARDLADGVLEGVLCPAPALLPLLVLLLCVLVERGVQAVVARLEVGERGAGLSLLMKKEGKRICSCIR